MLLPLPKQTIDFSFAVNKAEYNHSGIFKRAKQVVLYYGLKSTLPFHLSLYVVINRKKANAEANLACAYFFSSGTILFCLIIPGFILTKTKVSCLEVNF